MSTGESITEYVQVVGRWGQQVGDGLDPDSLPNFLAPDAGSTVTLTPAKPATIATDPEGNPLGLTRAPITCTFDADGWLTFNGERGVWVADLGGPGVNPVIPRNEAAWTAVFNLRYGGKAYPWPTISFNPAAGSVCNLVTATGLPLGPGSVIVRGPEGTGVASLDVDGDHLTWSLTDGSTGETPLPAALVEADAQVAAAVVAGGPTTEALGEVIATATAQLDATGRTAAEINDWLATPSPLGFKRLVGTAQVNIPLTVQSDTHLDCSGATIIATVGNRQGLLRNAACGGSGARDSNITVIGGYFDKNGQTYDNSGDGSRFNGTGVRFHRVNGLTVTDATYADQGAITKYALAVGDVTRFTLTRLHFEDVHSDGLHILGPASGGVVGTITGKTGDDMVAITCRDYEDWTVGGNHDVTNVTFDGVFPDGSMAALKILAGAGARVDGITARCIKGTTLAAGVYAVDDDFDPDTTGGSWGHIVVDDVDLATGAGYAAVRIGMTTGTVESASISHISVKGMSGRAVSLGAGTLGRVVIDGLTAPAGHDSSLISVDSGSVGTLSVRNAHATLKADKSAGRLVSISSGATVGTVSIDDVDATGGDALVINAGTVGQIKIGRTSVDAGCSVWAQAATTVVTGAGVTQVHGYFVQVSGSGAATLLGAGCELLNASGTITRTGSQAVRVNGLGYQVDVSQLAGMVAGDMAYNTNASLGCGEGAVVVSGGGGIWKNLYSGATN